MRVTLKNGVVLETFSHISCTEVQSDQIIQIKRRRSNGSCFKTEFF